METLSFDAVRLGVSDDFCITVGFEMQTSPEEDSKGLLISRPLPGDEEEGFHPVEVEFGYPQQYMTYDNIESAVLTPHSFTLKMTKEGAKKLSGYREISVVFKAGESEFRRLKEALDYIFEGFSWYKTAL